MKTQFYPLTIICILILVCSSCSITRQTACPTFANKTEKVHKPLFSKKKSSKKEKKQCAKISDKTKNKKTQNNRFAQIESLISKIEMNDLTASSGNDIVLNSTDITPFIESKIQKFLYKKIEKKSKKVLKALEKRNQKKNVKENDEQIISRKNKKRKRKKIFNNKDDGPTGELETHDFAIMSLVSGIAIYLTPFLASLIGGWFLLPVVLLAILAINWGVIGRRKIKENPSKYKGEGMALTGLILGIVAFGVLITLLAFILLLVASYNGSL